MVGQLESSVGGRKTSHDHGLVRNAMSQGLKRMALTEPLTNVPQLQEGDLKSHDLYLDKTPLPK